MATNIRRSLIVGLGGTGMDTLLRIKKLFVETYGELPPMIGLLGVDTDGSAYKKTIPSRYGDIALDPSEQLAIKINNARDIYVNNKDHFKWVFSENVPALAGLKNAGAGQVRTNGRFVLKVNSEAVLNKIRSATDAVLNARARQESQYSVLGNDNTLDIHIIFSVCGGTGAGTFIDMAYLLQHIRPNDPITGYGVLPDVFETMSNAGMNNVKPNAFGAVQDLDFLMKLAFDKDPITLDFINEQIETVERPFKNFFFIDNKNTSGDVYDHVNQLEDMLALALVASSGDLGAANTSVGDNLSQLIDGGSMDIAGKKAWASAMGVCEIVFHRDDLKKVYTLDSMRRIIDRLRNSTIPVDNIVNGWIDSAEVNIRENQGNDNVINFIMPLNPEYPISALSDPKDAKPEVEGYLGKAVPTSDKVTEKVKELSNRVHTQLSKLIVTNINSDGGVVKTKRIIESLKKQLDIFLNEMQAELKKLQEVEEPSVESALKNAQSELTNYMKKLIHRNSRQYCEDVENAATQLVIKRRDIARHEGAIVFFTSLINEVNSYCQSINRIEENLKTIYDKATDEIASIQNPTSSNTNLFSIDLTERRGQTIDIPDSALNLNDYLLSLSHPGVLAFENMRSDDLRKNLTDFIEKLDIVKQWDSVTVEQIIKELNEDEFNDLMHKAYLKSVPTLNFDKHGYIGMQPADIYYVGVENKADSRLKENDNFKNSILSPENGAPNVDFASIGMSDRIIIYHQSGVVPAFQIGPLMSYENKYKRCPVSAHFDKAIKLRMESEDYALMPRNDEDESLELWVKGIIHKRIINEKGVYYIVSENHGDPLENFRYKLHSERHSAFDRFISELATFASELRDAIVKAERNLGHDKLNEMYADIKKNYYENYSIMTVTKETLKTKSYKEDKKLIDKELTYVAKTLSL